MASKDARRIAAALEQSVRLQRKRVALYVVGFLLGSAALVVALVLDWPWPARACLIFCILGASLSAVLDGLLLKAKQSALADARRVINQHQGADTGGTDPA